MSRSSRNRRDERRRASQDTNVFGLQLSTQDDVGLCIAVESRFIDLCGAFRRIRGVDLAPPEELDAAMLLWRRMAVRYKQRDYRHHPDELAALKEIASWTVQVNRALRNQLPQSMKWKEDVGIL